MSARTRSVSAVEADRRAVHARAFLLAAQLVDELGEDAGIDPATTIVGSLAVLAGIAASDAICGLARGERSGENHADAVLLLRRSTPPGSSASTQLKRLLDAKSTAHYSADLISPTKAAELLSAASRLVAHMDTIAPR